MSIRALLSAEQRSRLFAIPVERAEMARHYVLAPDDLVLIGAKRRAPNRLGFAIQLCLLRYPGQGLGPGDHPPEPLVGFIAEQLGLTPGAFAEYAARDLTRREHAAELQALLGLRRFGLVAWRDCLRVGSEAAWATDRGEPIVRAMLDQLRLTSIMLPAPHVLERIGLEARVRARRRAFEALAFGLTDASRQVLDGLLTNDPEVGRSRFTWLRDCPESPAPCNMVELLDRLDYVRSLGVDADRARRIHPGRLTRLVDEGGIMTAQHIADLEPARRTALLVAQVAHLDTRVADATLAMFEKYIGSLFTKARSKDERRFQATKRDVAKALLLFRRTIAALKKAKQAGEDGEAAVEREAGMAQLDRALPTIEAVADVADQDILLTAAEKYSVLRRFSPRFLASFQFQSNVAQDPVLAAIEVIKAADQAGAKTFAKRPPASFLSPKWRRLIFASGPAERRLYETAVLAVLRERLRGADIWVAGSRDYRTFEDYFLPADAGRRHRDLQRGRRQHQHRPGGSDRQPRRGLRDRVAVGLVNGLLVAGLGLQSLAATIGTMIVCQGIALLVLDAPGGEVADAIATGLTADLFGVVPVAAVLLVALCVVWRLLTRTRTGIALYAVGADRIAAGLSGLNVRGTTRIAFAAAGLCYALAGYMLSAQTGTGDPRVSNSFLLFMFASVAIGGTSLMGVRGGLVGSVIGAGILTVMQKMLFALGVASFYTNVSNGLIMLLAILFGNLSLVLSRLSRRRGSA